MEYVNLLLAGMPLWIIWVFPFSWIYILLANLLIDLLVYLIIINVFKLKDKIIINVKKILTLYVFDLLSSGLGSIIINFILSFILKSWTSYTLLSCSIGIFISMLIMFLISYFGVFAKYEQKQRLIISVIITISFAPYSFYFSMPY